ncbi:MAG: cytochrome b [Xanthomonadales bacterium]|nr:cytochrome b [Xanthomonadales bacterium]
MVITAPARYTRTAIVLHWLIFLLLIVQFIVGWSMPHIGRNTPVTTLISVHFSLGVLILALIVVRLAWRLTHAAPPQDASVPRWQANLAQVVQWLLYLLLLVVPLLGWLNASYRGMPITFFEMFPVPPLLATHAAGWSWTGDIHIAVAEYGILVLAGLHIAAALYHHFIRHDRVLQRMLPGA